MKKIILLLTVITTLSFGYSPEQIHKDIDTLFTFVSDTHEIRINGNLYEVDMRELLLQTARIESNFARDKYTGQVGKTFMQIEEKSALWYLGKAPELKKYLEECLGREIKWDRDEDAVFTAYIFYHSKLLKHYKWLDRFSHTKYFTGDIEWYVYKIFYNSTAGASTYKKWLYRKYNA